MGNLCLRRESSRSTHLPDGYRLASGAVRSCITGETRLAVTGQCAYAFHRK